MGLTRLRWYWPVLLVLVAPASGDTPTATTAPDDSAARIWIEVDLLFMRPSMKESFQATSTVPPAGPMSLVPFETDFALSPRVDIGYALTEDFGVRASFWHYDHNVDRYARTSTLGAIQGANVVSTVFPAAIAAPPGATLAVDSALLVQSLDLEGVIPIQVGRTELTATGGLQYARLEQTFDASVFGTPIALNWDRDMRGIGPTLAIEARHPLGESGLTFIGGGRGALLVGEKNLNRTVVGDVTPVPAPAAIALNDSREPTGVFELSLGVEWSQEVGDWCDLFVAAQYEAQLWTEAGAPTMTYVGFDGFVTSFGLRF